MEKAGVEDEAVADAGDGERPQDDDSENGASDTFFLGDGFVETFLKTFAVSSALLTDWSFQEHRMLLVLSHDYFKLQK